MPLTAAGGANAVNHQDGSPEGREGKEAEPAVKKSKGVEKSKAALTKKKSSLRRSSTALCPSVRLTLYEPGTCLATTDQWKLLFCSVLRNYSPQV